MFLPKVRICDYPMENVRTNWKNHHVSRGSKWWNFPYFNSSECLSFPVFFLTRVPDGVSLWIFVHRLPASTIYKSKILASTFPYEVAINRWCWTNFSFLKSKRIRTCWDAGFAVESLPGKNPQSRSSGSSKKISIREKTVKTLSHDRLISQLKRFTLNTKNKIKGNWSLVSAVRNATSSGAIFH